MSDELPCIKTAHVPGPRSAALANRLAAIESPDTTYLSANFPVFWESGRGCLVTDVDGNSFLDAAASFGALSVGHCHPKVVAAINRQSRQLIHGMGDVHPSRVKVELLQKIATHAPIPDGLTILGLSGSDSVEAALKTAFLATGKPGLLAFDGGYHGLSIGALEPTARGFFRDPFDQQRGRFAKHLPFGCALTDVRRALSQSVPPIGAVIVEPIQGRGGIRIPPSGWLPELVDVCRNMGILVIFDEIYTGWGRTGKLFACEWEGVSPDLICIGKAMGGGMPISALVGRSEIIVRAWPKSRGEALHTSTFLGHPVACAASIAAIDVIVGRRLAGRTNRLGDPFLTSLVELAEKHTSSIVQARGRGLMIGLECRSARIARSVAHNCLRRGLIVLSAGDNGRVIELTPPLTISKFQLQWCVATLAEAIAAVPP